MRIPTADIQVRAPRADFQSTEAPPGIASAPFEAIAQTGEAISKIGLSVDQKLQALEREKSVLEISSFLDQEVVGLDSRLDEDRDPATYHARATEGFREIADMARERAKERRDAFVTLGVDKAIAEKQAAYLTHAKGKQRKLQIEDAEANIYRTKEALIAGSVGSTVDAARNTLKYHRFLGGYVKNSMLTPMQAEQAFRGFVHDLHTKRLDRIATTDPDAAIKEVETGLYDFVLGANKDKYLGELERRKARVYTESERQIKLDQDATFSSLVAQMLRDKTPPSPTYAQFLLSRRRIRDEQANSIVKMYEGWEQQGGSFGDITTAKSLALEITVFPTKYSEMDLFNMGDLTPDQRRELLNLRSERIRQERTERRATQAGYGDAASVGRSNIKLAFKYDGINPLGKTDTDALLAALKEFDQVVRSEGVSAKDLSAKAWEIAERHRVEMKKKRDAFRSAFSSRQEMLEEAAKWHDPSKRAASRFNRKEIDSDWWNAEYRYWEEKTSGSGKSLQEEKKRRGMD